MFFFIQMKVVQLRKSACKIHVHYFSLRSLFTKGALPSYSSWLLLFMGEHSESRAFASSTKELAPQKRNLFTFRKSLDLFIFSLPAFHTVKEWRILVQKLDFHINLPNYNFEFWRQKIQILIQNSKSKNSLDFRIFGAKIQICYA